VSAAGTQVALSAYASDILRDNLFNQSEASGTVRTGAVRHTLLAGVELGSQRTGNYRRTGYFDGTTTSATVSVSEPTVSLPVEFRQSATDADNRVLVRTTSAYLQDQLVLGSAVQVVVGVRVDRFALDFTNRRTAAGLSRTDRMVSPRVGLVFKPIEPLSLYGNASVSHLPSAGDQFGSLTASTQALEPERFTNREVGAKWDPLPALSLTLAAYRLDRTNTSAPDPADASRLVQTGRQRSQGIELGASGNLTPRWQVQGGFAVQRAEITDRTSAAAPGARVPLVPRRSGALWNRYDFTPRLGAGLGLIHQGESYAAIDNTVTLPAFTRADAALFALLDEGVRLQLNVENLRNARYYATSHGNNNILPGAPRSLRVSVSTGF
jgi:catecholate siderophore receptor